MTMTTWMVAICAAIAALSLQNVNSQIPTECADQVSLDTLTCCPNGCGESDNRGECMDIDFAERPHDMTTTDVRRNWPHYFTRACKCSGNYGGVDCSRCKYGYYGATCDQKEVLARSSIQELDDEEWAEYIDIIRETRTFNSGYKIVLGEYVPGTTDFETADIDLYDFFVWAHHYTAKDAGCGGKA